MIDVQFVWMTGLLGGIFFILNFTTCYSMPWASKCSEGDKCKKNCPHRKPLCEHHKPLAWLTVLTGVFHIIVSVIWYFGF